MKYFNEGNTENGYGPKGIILNDTNDDGIFSLSIQNDLITIMEECDGYFQRDFTKDQAIELLNEAIDWIKKQ